MTYLAAVVQLTTTTDSKASVDAAGELVAQAAKSGASLVALPENVSFMGPEEEKLRLAEPIDGPTFSALGAWAKAHRVWLLGGTLPERGPTPERAYNTSTLWSPEGRLVARYRKIHLFDVELGEGATHRESRSVIAGEQPVLAETPLGTIGMTVCYDLRFPGLYRALVRAGADLLTVPAAFTVPTGRDHWEVLLRARAIESECYVLAPGQCGQNTKSRATFGRSLVADPWGTLLCTAPDRPSVALAEIDLGRIRSLRERLPTLRHERPELYPSVNKVRA
jgi:predicted amidohydrolase